MPQAPLKKSKVTSLKSDKLKVVRNAGVIRKGLRSYAPKAKNAARENAQRKLTGQLTASTEKRLAACAGHLELLAGGKRDAKKSSTKEEVKKP
ncbi:hypothetical protein BDD12DRAFT_887583 [Trichophaea hybrida]|nr:hypothetical protein BDD12DRAFT_887583 [Trichophaea hybrida]